VGKLVVLKLGDGSFAQGFPVTLQIGEETARPSTEVTGNLPANPEIFQTYQQWQSAYRQLSLQSRLSAPSGQVTNVSLREECNRAAAILQGSLNRWLNTEPFRIIREKLLEQLSPSNEIRMVLQTRDIQLQRLPWHLWDFFERYSKAEAALSAPIYEQAGQMKSASGKVRILAILGNSSNINIQADRALLEQLPQATVNFLAEPSRRELTDQFWRQSWDILFFAGHSSTHVDTDTGWIELNSTERLSIAQLKYALRKGVERGLKIAIFNSCDGLGLAQNLSDLRIPQIIVMRDPVPDQIAQEFLKNFLEAFSRGESFYLSVREARERLEGMEDEFPCATWLPIIFQNPAEVPPTWNELCGGEDGLLAEELIFQNLGLSPLAEAIAINPIVEPAVASVDEFAAPEFPEIPEVSNIPEMPDQAFLKRCQKELAAFVGPISNVILKNVLANHPQISSLELVDALATKISNSQQAEILKQRLTAPLETLSSETIPPKTAVLEAESTVEPHGQSLSTSEDIYLPTESSHPSTPNPQPSISISANPTFVEQCRTELIRYIGPIGNFVMKDVLAKHPQSSAQQLVEILATKISNPQQSEAFKHRLQTMLHVQPKGELPKPPPQGISYRSFSHSSVTDPKPETSADLDPSFLEQCRWELAKSIGPIAGHVLKTATIQHPHATQQQLIEILASSIPNSRQAEAFKQKLLSL